MSPLSLTLRGLPGDGLHAKPVKAQGSKPRDPGDPRWLDSASPTTAPFPAPPRRGCRNLPVHTCPQRSLPLAWRGQGRAPLYSGTNGGECFSEGAGARLTPRLGFAADVAGVPRPLREGPAPLSFRAPARGFPSHICKHQCASCFRFFSLKV